MCCRHSWRLPWAGRRWCWCARTGPRAASTRRTWSMWCCLISPGTPPSMCAAPAASPEAPGPLVLSPSLCLAARRAPHLSSPTHMIFYFAFVSSRPGSPNGVSEMLASMRSGFNPLNDPGSFRIICQAVATPRCPHCCFQTVL